jgi:IS5 family transposase
VLLKSCAAIDATLIAALSLTKNRSGARDQHMHQPKKGKQWRFGMKAHVKFEVDADSDWCTPSQPLPPTPTT